jgi:hypothetical protein
VLPLCDAIRMGVMDVGAAAEFPSSHRHLLQGGMPACGLLPLTASKPYPWTLDVEGMG